MSSDESSIEEAVPIQKPDTNEQKVPVMNAIPPEMVLRRAPTPESRESAQEPASLNTTIDES